MPRIYIEELDSTHQFDDHYHPGVDPRIWTKSGGADILLSNVQMIALIMNDICVRAGKGWVRWYPVPMHNINELPNLVYRARVWTDDERRDYWATSPMQRLENAEVRNRDPSENTEPIKSLMITAAILDNDNCNDIMAWQEYTTGLVVLCIRRHEILVGWLAHWQTWANRHPTSSFAHNFHSGQPDKLPKASASYTVEFDKMRSKTRPEHRLEYLDGVRKVFDLMLGTELMYPVEHPDALRALGNSGA